MRPYLNCPVLSAVSAQSTDAGDAFNTFWKAMEQLDHVAQPLAFATASLGLASSPKRNGSYSSDTDTEGSGRTRRTLLGGRTKAQSSEVASTTPDDAHGPDAAKSSNLKQSVTDLRSEFDEIAEEGKFHLVSSSICHGREGDTEHKITTRLIRFVSSHPNPSPLNRRLKRRTAPFAPNSKGCRND